MNTQAQPQHVTDPARSMRRRSFFKGALTGGLIGTVLAVAVTVQAHNGGFHRTHMMGGPMGDPAAMAERMEFGVDFMLAKIGASDQQKSDVRSIVRDAASDLAPLQRQHRANRDALRAALLAPAIDKAALDSLRVSELKLADQAALRLQEALLAAAEVLTPEQRKAIAERLEQRRQRHRQS